LCLERNGATGAVDLALLSAADDHSRAQIDDGVRAHGANCNTSFTWQIATRYSELSATVIVDQFDSGPATIAFRSGRAALKFTGNGHSFFAFKVGANPARLQVPLRGLRQLTIALRNAGSDAGTT
jgi:hypothetical protein